MGRLLGKQGEKEKFVMKIVLFVWLETKNDGPKQAKRMG